MTEQNILSTLFPAHADLQPILEDLRRKYDLPKLGLMDKNLLLSDKDIPWDEIKQDLRTRVETHPELWPEAVQKFRTLIQNNQGMLDNPDALPATDDPNQEQLRSATNAMMNLIRPLAEAFNRMVDDMCEMLFVNLATGEIRQIPQDWLGAVYTQQIFGEPVVVAMAGQLSNPKEITERFTAEMHRVFGKDRPKVTDEFKNTADYLRMKFEGVPLMDIADEYMQNNPSEFTKDIKSPAHREQRRRLISRLKKSMQRNEKKLLELVGDKTKT